MPVLHIRSGSQAGTSFPFDRDIVIGRAPMADLVLADPTVSRRHARIARVAEGYGIADLGSGNGTLVNGRRITEPRLLESGDRLQLGRVALELGGEDPADSRHGASIEWTDLLEQDLALAARIQQSFLPQASPEVPGYDIGYDYSPALWVGGDYLDLFDLGGGGLAIAVGDVSGKGISAALYMAGARSELRQAARDAREPQDLVRSLNRSLYASTGESMFLTLLLLALEPESGQVRVVSAGHPAALVRRADGALSTFPSKSNLPLGVAPDLAPTQEVFHLHPGDSVLALTDGVMDAESPAGERLGLEGVRDLFVRLRGSSQEVLDGILAEIKRLLADRPQGDDLTLVCCQRAAGRPSG